MKKILKSFLFAAIGLFALASCEDVPAPYEIPTQGENTGGSEVVTPAEPAGSGTVADPYNVAAAIAAVSAMEADVISTEDYYIKGIVVSIAENFGDNTYGNANFYIADTQDSKTKFYCFQVLGLGNKKCSDSSVLNVGDEVVVCGKVVNYKGNTPETANKGQAYIYSVNGKTEMGNDEPGQPDTPAVEAKGDGTLENPFNPAGANAFVAAGENLDREVYIKGVVSKVRECSAQYGNASFYITEDGTGEEENSFLIWRAAGLDNKKVDSDDYVKVGDEVIVKGICVNYNGTYETAQGKAYIYSLTRKDNGGQTPDDPNTEVGNDQTIDLSTFGYANADDVTEVKAGDVTLLFAQNEGNNAPKYYSATNGVRMYALNSLTITAKKQMKGVKLVCDSYNGTDYVGNATLYAEPGKASVSGTDLIVSDINAAKVSIVNHHSGNSGGVQLRVKKVVIEYAE